MFGLEYELNLLLLCEYFYAQLNSCYSYCKLCAYRFIHNDDLCDSLSINRNKESNSIRKIKCH